jgi:hypothetical protein
VTREEWLQQLAVGDLVTVYASSNRMEVATITAAPGSFVTIGKHGRKLNFSRATGLVCGKRLLKHLFRIEPA